MSLDDEIEAAQLDTDLKSAGSSTSDRWPERSAGGGTVHGSRIVFCLGVAISWGLSRRIRIPASLGCQASAPATANPKLSLCDCRQIRIYHRLLTL